MPEVRVTADLRLATVYVMPLGGRDAENVVAAFEQHKKFLRAEMAHRINLKFAPDIRFRVDERFAEAERIEKLLHSPEVKRDLKIIRTKSERARESTTLFARTPRSAQRVRAERGPRAGSAATSGAAKAKEARQT